MIDLKEAPSQTAGPYVHIGCVPTFAGLDNMYDGVDLGAHMVTGTPLGQQIELSIKVHDGEGELLKDAMIEIWQAGPDGTFGPTDGFTHWGRQPTDADSGLAIFQTLKPAGPQDQAPHILVWIAARGINMALTTRIYFPDEDNMDDHVFKLAGERASTMVAEKTQNGYQHSCVLRGDNETVFFDV